MSGPFGRPRPAGAGPRPPLCRWRHPHDRCREGPGELFPVDREEVRAPDRGVGGADPLLPADRAHGAGRLAQERAPDGARARQRPGRARPRGGRRSGVNPAPPARAAPPPSGAGPCSETGRWGSGGRRLSVQPTPRGAREGVRPLPEPPPGGAGPAHSARKPTAPAARTTAQAGARHTASAANATAATGRAGAEVTASVNTGSYRAAPSSPTTAAPAPAIAPRAQAAERSRSQNGSAPTTSSAEGAKTAARAIAAPA